MESTAADLPLVERTFGPPSRQTERLTRRMRRIWFPLASGWRMTPRGIRMLQRLVDPTERVPVLRGTKIEPTTVGGVRAEWVRAPRAQQARAEGAPVLVYFHGGGYVFGSPRTHRNLISRISHVTGLPVLSVDYRLPPQWTMPAAIEDALAVYRAVVAEYDPARLVVLGDSAGGNLVYELALHAAEEGLPQPAGLVLLSPWTDLTVGGDSIRANASTDPFIPEAGLRRCARVAVGGADPSGWRFSPLFAPVELQRQLPPTLIQVGATELLHADGVRTARTLAEAGVSTELDVFSGTIHVAIAWLGTPEAREALHRIATFVHAVLPLGASSPVPSDEAAVEAASNDLSLGPEEDLPTGPGLAP